MKALCFSYLDLGRDIVHTTYNLKLQEANKNDFTPQISVLFDVKANFSSDSNIVSVPRYSTLVQLVHSQSFSHKSSHLTFHINRQRQ